MRSFLPCRFFSLFYEFFLLLSIFNVHLHRPSFLSFLLNSYSYLYIFSCVIFKFSITILQFSLFLCFLKFLPFYYLCSLIQFNGFFGLFSFSSLTDTSFILTLNLHIFFDFSLFYLFFIFVRFPCL